MLFRTARWALALLFILTFAISAGKSQNNSAASAKPGDMPEIAFEKYTLPNGLQVILHVDRKLPMVHVNNWYHVGSKNERFGRTGFAHLFEHMMFEGSKDANTKYLAFVEKAGANLFEGGVNGTTNEDRTNYFETVPSGSLEYILWLESDRLATLTDVLTKEKLDNERDIVKNERRQGLENQPYGRWFTLLAENVYPNGHPYAHTVIGSQEDLTAASADDVKDFFHSYYTPNNLSLTITGDFDPAEAKRLIEKYYAPIPPGPALDRPKHWVPILSAEKIIEVKDHVPQERTYFSWPAPAFFDPGDADLDLTSLILTDGLSSRLNKALVYDKQLCSDVVSFEDSKEIAGDFIIWVTARPGASLSQAEQDTTEEIKRLAKEGPTAEELDRAKTKWESQYITGLERIGGFGGKADQLNTYNTFLGDPNKFAADVERHRSVTAESLRESVAKWLDTPNRVVIRFHPEDSKLDTAAKVDRAKPPQLASDRPFNAPEVKSAKLDNGIEVLVAERKDLPKVAVRFATHAGSVADTSGKEGLASMTLEVMKRGTASKKALEIDTAVGDLGTSLEGQAGRESSDLALEVLKRNLPPALAVLADVAQHPSFPADEIDRERKLRLAELTQAETDPNQISARISPMLAYGRNHPYGHPTLGFPSSVEKITREDLVQFHNTYWKPSGSALIFVGDITLAEATKLAGDAFASWKGKAPAVTIPAPQPIGPGKVFLVNRPDAAQTDVAEVLPAPARSSSDYYALNLANAVWGGQAGARLGMNLREDKGYSYGVFSFPAFNSKYSMWRAFGGVQTNKTKESVIEFQKELKFIAGEKPVSDKELTDARNSRIRGYAQQFESMNRVAGQIEALWNFGLPMSELQREPEELQKASLESVNTAAQKYAKPSGASLLLVGDLSKIEPGIRELNLGEIVLLDPEGSPINK